MKLPFKTTPIPSTPEYILDAPDAFGGMTAYFGDQMVVLVKDCVTGEILRKEKAEAFRRQNIKGKIVFYWKKKGTPTPRIDNLIPSVWDTK